MKLTKIPTATDKVAHAYLEVYERLFDRTMAVGRMIELGVYAGDSIQLWDDYFDGDVDIVGVDIDLSRVPLDDYTERVSFIQADAYTEDFVTYQQHYDIILDDGPHTLPSMQFVCSTWTSRLVPGGLLVIEDVPSIDWIAELTAALPEHLRRYAYGVDRRAVATTQTDDSIMFVVDL